MNIKNNTDVGKYGLPKEVKYCIKCNITNQRPTSTNEYKHDKDTFQIPISFDKNELSSKLDDVKKKILKLY